MAPFPATALQEKGTLHSCFVLQVPIRKPVLHPSLHTPPPAPYLTPSFALPYLLGPEADPVPHSLAPATIYSCIHQGLIEQSLCATLCSRDLAFISDQNRDPCSAHTAAGRDRQ